MLTQSLLLYWRFSRAADGEFYCSFQRLYIYDLLRLTSWSVAFQEVLQQRARKSIPLYMKGYFTTFLLRIEYYTQRYTIPSTNNRFLVCRIQKQTGMIFFYVAAVFHFDLSSGCSLLARRLRFLEDDGGVIALTAPTTTTCKRIHGLE